jgi:hypothetical protein
MQNAKNGDVRRRQTDVAKNGVISIIQPCHCESPEASGDEAISNFFFTLLFYIKNLKQNSLNHII